MNGELPEISIIMPCLNEELTIGQCIVNAQNWLRENNVFGEVIIGDNGSTDNSVDIAAALGAEVIDVPIMGYGAACYYASCAANGKYIIMGDSDGSYDFSELTLFLQRLRQGADLVIGNRFKGGIRHDAMPWKNRYIGNPVLSFIARRLFNLPVKDVHCGLRGYTADAFRKMDLQTTGMEFASEMIIKAKLLNMEIAEVPTVLSKDGRAREPHLRPWRDGWRHLKFMFLFSPRWLFWYPGWASIIVGVILITLLFPGPVHLGEIRLDIHSMLYASLMITAGYQSITFGIITRKLGFNLGLLPSKTHVRAFERHFKLEYVLVAGAILIILGIIGLIYSILSWGSAGFGDLDPYQMMRIVITTALLLIIGIQSILFAFVVSFIDLGVRRNLN